MKESVANIKIKVISQWTDLSEKMHHDMIWLRHGTASSGYPIFRIVRYRFPQPNLDGTFSPNHPWRVLLDSFPSLSLDWNGTTQWMQATISDADLVLLILRFS